MVVDTQKNLFNHLGVDTFFSERPCRDALPLMVELTKENKNTTWHKITTQRN